jgi:pimeloyl-ACP methyl ester carboxylesterase
VTDSPHPDLEIQALNLLGERAAPRRRARPRVARALGDAEQHDIETPFGVTAAWKLGDADAPAVLLVHGWEDDNALWGPAIEAFAAWGRPVIAIDLPGHGFSPSQDASIKSAGAAIVETARRLGPVTAVVGHSYGCGAIIHALGHGLAADRAVLIATPVPRTRPRLPLVIDGVDAAVLARAEVLRQDRARQQSEKIEQAIAAMTTPMLAIHSLDDEQCPFANAQRLTALWPGSDLLAVDSLGHRFIAQDRDVIERMIAFVEA